MEQSGVCAVVVTYHPDEDLIENLERLLPQVGAMIVVDNGSPEWARTMLAEAAERLGFTIAQNWENLGSAAALNRGVTWARDRQFEWVMLFDQESAVTPGFVAGMVRCAQESLDPKSLAILLPRYRDARPGASVNKSRRDEVGLECARIPGSLMPTEVFDVAGLFLEELFLEEVDTEYSLRVRQFGLRIDECAEASLLYSPGSPTYHKMFWSKPFHAANLSPVRRYYQQRNRVLVYRRYGRTFRGFFVREFLASAKDFIKILGVEDDKWNKCHYFLRGIRDGFGGRKGKLLE